MGRWSLPMSSRILSLQSFWRSAETMVRSGLNVDPLALWRSVGVDEVSCNIIRLLVLHNSSTLFPMVFLSLYPTTGMCALKSPAMMVFLLSVMLIFICFLDFGGQYALNSVNCEPWCHICISCMSLPLFTRFFTSPCMSFLRRVAMPLHFWHTHLYIV